jgi:exoribonuclease R
MTFVNKKAKLFEDDVIKLDDDTGDFILKDSPVRDSVLAGVLITGKTFGRSGRRLLYKCIPDNPRIPPFLLPYAVPIGFSKAVKNKYVAFRFVHWDDDHPRGEIKETFGDVDSAEAFYDYQVCRKNLNVSLSSFTIALRAVIKRDEILSPDPIWTIRGIAKYEIEDLRTTFVFSIDPLGCTDIDDAFSVLIEDNVATVSVYIANVFLFLETFALWDFLSDRVSTVYLPNKKLPMLPSLMSDTLCSLKAGEDRVAFMMSIKYDLVTKKQLGDPVYKNVLICVNKNYAYDDRALNHRSDYRILRELSSEAPFSEAPSSEAPFSEAPSSEAPFSESSSHDVVAYWMVKMNTECAAYLSRRGCGVFRGTLSSATKSRRFFEFCASAYSETPSPHLPLNIDAYVHITSPIRRLVDILNQIWFMKSMFLVSDSSILFLEKWLKKLDFVNVASKNVRRIQSDCELLALVSKNSELVDREFLGVVFDKVCKKDFYEYAVYIQELKLFTVTKSEYDLKNESTHRFKLFFFQDEARLCRKVRVLLDT